MILRCGAIRAKSANSLSLIRSKSGSPVTRSPQIGNVAVFHPRAEVDTPFNLVVRHFPDTGIGMSHDTLSHTHLTGFPSQRDALLGRRVPRCENDIRLGTYLHDSHDFRQHTPVIVHDGHTLFLAVIADVLVNGILCRHPDTTTKIAGCGYGFSAANTFTLSPCTRFIHRLPNTSNPCNS